MYAHLSDVAVSILRRYHLWNVLRSEMKRTVSGAGRCAAFADWASFRVMQLSRKRARYSLQAAMKMRIS